MAYKVTNEAKGARGVSDFTIDAGVTLESVDLAEMDALLLGEIDGVTVEEVKKAAKKTAE